MSDFLPPPTHIEPFTLDEATGRWMFSPIWMQWFIDVTAFITASGGGGGGAADHESLAGLLGGSAGQHYHTDNTQYTELVGNKAAHLVYAGPAAGGATTPAFRTLVPGDIPTGAVVAFGLDGEDGELGDQGVPGPVGPSGPSVMGPPGLDGESADLETLGFGVTGVSITGANGIGVSGSPITSSGTIGLSLGAITPTSVSTPSIITASGALGITPAAGSGLNVSLSGAGDFAVNTDDLYVDTSTGFVGINCVASNTLTVFGTVSAVVTAAQPYGFLMTNRNFTRTWAFGCDAFTADDKSFYITDISGNAVRVFIDTAGLLTNRFNFSNQGDAFFAGQLIAGSVYSIPIGNSNKIQIQGGTPAASSLGISAWSADALGPRIELGKSRNAALGTHTIVQDGDVVGSLLGYGANGSTFTNLASISMEVDGTPGATNDMPGRIVFKTTPDGSGTLAEALRISQDKSVTFAGAIKLASVAISPTAPTIASGFGTTPSVVASNGTAAFTINVGTGGTASAGVITLPTAATGWIVHVENITATAANSADQRTVQTASTTTSVTVQNQTVSTGAALAWSASDILVITAVAY